MGLLLARREFDLALGVRFGGLTDCGGRFMTPHERNSAPQARTVIGFNSQTESLIAKTGRRLAPRMPPVLITQLPGFSPASRTFTASFQQWGSPNIS